MLLPYVGFFPCEIMFLPLADVYFLMVRNYKLKLKAREREACLKKTRNCVPLIINCLVKSLAFPVPLSSCEAVDLPLETKMHSGLKGHPGPDQCVVSV